MVNMKRTKAKYELILFFEKFQFSPNVAFKKLEKFGYSRATIYRYHREWQECQNIVKSIEKEL